MIDRERHVDDDRHLRSDAGRADPGPSASGPDLLLVLRCDGDDPFCRARLVGASPAERLEGR